VERHVCRIDFLVCVCNCRGQSGIPVRLLIRDYGNRTFIQVLAKLRCRQCGKSPASVYLRAVPQPMLAPTSYLRYEWRVLSRDEQIAICNFTRLAP
jgi:hypothetical protein